MPSARRVLSLPHRIAAGALVFRDDRLLLVRHRTSARNSILACPGGAARDFEAVHEAAVRETREETGVEIRPDRVVLVEDLLCPKFKMCKVWLLCDYLGGTAQLTQEGKIEDIVEVGWYRRADLDGETVYPEIVLKHPWARLRAASWQPRLLPLRSAKI